MKHRYPSPSAVRSLSDFHWLAELDVCNQNPTEVTLEICPGSNIALGVSPDWQAHPVARLADAGLRVTVSTDDPPFFHTTMRHEYDRLASSFGWGDTEFRQINRFAAEAAFCDAATRERLLKEFA